MGYVINISLVCSWRLLFLRKCSYFSRQILFKMSWNVTPLHLKLASVTAWDRSQPRIEPIVTGVASCGAYDVVQTSVNPFYPRICVDQQNSQVCWSRALASINTKWRYITRSNPIQSDHICARWHIDLVYLNKFNKTRFWNPWVWNLLVDLQNGLCKFILAGFLVCIWHRNGVAVTYISS